MGKGALGKGLSALIPDRAKLNQDEGTDENVSFLKTADIQDNALQPRTNYDDEKLADLISSIKEKGMLQPILVREVDGEYQVVAGERRLRAARELNIDKVPVIIKNVSNQEALVLALVENIQREELNAIEEADAFSRLVEEFGFSQDELAKSVGKNRSTVSNTMRLLKLPDEIQASVACEEISMGHARALLGVEDAKQQKALFNKIVKDGLSVREIENLVKATSSETKARSAKRNKTKSHEIVALEEDLQRTLGSKVTIQAQKKRGKIIIEYYSNEDLDRVLNIIRR